MRLMPLLIIASLASAAAAELPRREVENSADPRDKVICKRYVETGSLVRSYRTCRTKADWDRQRDIARQTSNQNSCSLLAEGGSCR